MIKCYDSLEEASTITGINAGHISSVANKKDYRKLAGKCYWKYKDDETDLKLLDGKALSKSLNYRRVRCIETGKIYNGLKEAAKTIDTTASNISRVCRGKTKTASGYHWEYVDK